MAPWSCAPGHIRHHCFQECWAAHRRKWRRSAETSFAWSRGSRWVTSGTSRDPGRGSADPGVGSAGDMQTWCSAALPSHSLSENLSTILNMLASKCRSKTTKTVKFALYIAKCFDTMEIINQFPNKTLGTYSFECFIDLVELFGLLRQLSTDISTNKDPLQVHPLPLHHHPQLQDEDI